VDATGGASELDQQKRQSRARREWIGLAAVVVVCVVGVGAVLRAKQHRDALPPPPTLPVVHAPGTTTELIVPSHELRVGAAMHATVVITNHTGHALEGTKCGAPFLISLRSERAYQEANFPLCAETYSLPVGRSTYPVTISSHFSTCTHDPNARLSDDRSMPHCLAAGRLPPLPKGKYRAYVAGLPGAVSSARPVEITVK
jgi:hypothetical protein